MINLKKVVMIFTPKTIILWGWFEKMIHHMKDGLIWTFFSRKETHSRLSRLKLLASFTTNFYYRSQTRGSPLCNWKECNILRLKHYNQDNMKLLLLEIYDVDEEEEWDIKEEGEEKPQEAAAQKMAGGALKADEDEVKQEIAKQAKKKIIFNYKQWLLITKIQHWIRRQFHDKKLLIYCVYVCLFLCIIFYVVVSIRVTFHVSCINSYFIYQNFA